MSWKETVLHPVTVGVTAVLGLFQVFQFEIVEVLLTVVWSQVGTLFGAATVAAFTLAPEVDVLPEGTLSAVALGLGFVFVGKKLYSVGVEVRRRV